MNKIKQRDPKALTEVMATGPLHDLVVKSQQIIASDRILQCLLPQELATHCRTMNVYNNRLVIAVDSAVWAARLRYSTPALLQKLKQQPQFKQLDAIQWRVRPI